MFPRLSILIPFYHDNPVALIEALAALPGAERVEVLAYDDGTGDAALTEAVSKTCANIGKRFKLMTASENKGRSTARNALVDAARAKWVLFLDADMRPKYGEFLKRYLDAIEGGQADILFGGFTVPETVTTKDTVLHQAFSETSDCLSVEDRTAAGPQYVCSSNLCVKKSVLSDEPFDMNFQGWGWEDSEWAARAGSRFTLAHIDNPADHLGLESTDTLLRRFKDSAGNYVRFVKTHPNLAQTLTLYRTSQKLAGIPGQGLLRPFYKMAVKLPLPMKLRVLALKLWRASWYAKAFKTAGL